MQGAAPAVVIIEHGNVVYNPPWASMPEWNFTRLPFSPRTSTMEAATHKPPIRAVIFRLQRLDYKMRMEASPDGNVSE